MPDTPADCYSAADRPWMAWSQGLRDRWLRPLLQRLARLGVSADQLTCGSFLAGLVACGLFLWSPLAGLALLGLHLMLDGLDGPLARSTGTVSRAGSFTDTSADQAVVVASTLTLMGTGHVAALPGALYALCYTVAVGFAMLRNALAIPYRWVLRPRLLVFAAIPLELWWFPGSLSWLLGACAAVMAFNVVTGFILLRRRLRR